MSSPALGEGGVVFAVAETVGQWAVAVLVIGGTLLALLVAAAALYRELRDD